MKSFTIRKLSALILCLFVFSLFSPLPSPAQEAAKTVRVGWFESAFNHTDQYGRRSGYGYEYQRKVAAYTGWNYEYVEGTWPDLLQMLSEGKIDLLSDVSYTDERAQHMLYSDSPMGSEDYYLFVPKSNTKVSRDDYSTLNGMRAGADKGSVQAGFCREWAETHGVEIKLVELTDTLKESLDMLSSGEIDAYVTLDSNIQSDALLPVCKVGSSDFFFAVSASRPDLASELNVAMHRIDEENKFYNQELAEKYLDASNADQFLSGEESAWLHEHGTIKVGYQDNYLAFCATDPETGELTGALKDYLAYASRAFENEQLSFEPVAFPTAAAAMEALKNGEIDCMFPANLSDYDAEEADVVMTPPLMRTEMLAVVRASARQEFVHKQDVTVAVNAGNPNYDMFLVDHYPGWETAHYEDTAACLKAVAAGEADCIIISNYRNSNISKLCQNLHLTTVSTGVDLDYCFAVRQGDTQLYAILARLTNLVPTSTVNAALTYYSAEDAKTSFSDFLKDHFIAILVVIGLVMAVILFLLVRSVRAERKVREEQHLVTDLNRRLYVDALTSVRNKGGYARFIQDLQGRLDGGEEISFAIGVLDCDNLKLVNDRFGHEKGDIYLKNACQLICQTFKHSPVFRIGGDEFVVVFQNEDYQNRDSLVEQFDEAQDAKNAEATAEWERVSVAMGVAVYDPSVDGAVSDTVHRADGLMYENKRARKQGRDATR